MNTHVMVDIEALGTTPGSVILSIGACGFDPENDGYGSLFYINIDIQSCLDAGLHVDGNTIEWWLKQSDPARLSLFKDPAPVKLRDGLRMFREFLLEGPGDFNSRYVWSHGSNFDLVLLEAGFSRVNLNVPWKYRNIRDTRTLFALAPGYEDLRAADALPKGANIHHALDDAMSQVLWVQTAYRLLKGAATVEAPVLTVGEEGTLSHFDRFVAGDR